jgi:LmbE family N-acetylglucosaminyl deacetylase
VVNPSTLLAVMAHPDDVELWAGGVVTRTVRAGGQVTILLPHADETRDREAAAGAAILGAILHMVDALSVATIRDLIVRMQPTLVITHHPNDVHPDHQNTADLVRAALPDAVITTGHPRRVYTCVSYHNLDRAGHPLHLPVIVDVTATWDTKLQALHAHASQPIDSHFGPMAETLGRLHGSRIGVPYAEAFAAMPVLGRVPATIAL